MSEIDLSKLVVGAKVRIGEPDANWSGHVFPVGWHEVVAVIPVGTDKLFRIAADPRMIQAKIIAEIAE